VKICPLGKSSVPAKNKPSEPVASPTNSMTYDLAVIGAGWAGFNAAISAAKLDKSVCLIESKEMGGTCLNRGCIPAKAFLQYSKEGLSFPEIKEEEGEIIQRLGAGMVYLAKNQKIDYVQGKAKIEADGNISIANDKKIKPKFILIATGSLSADLPQLKIDHQKVISSDDVFGLEFIPKKILIVGGGAIGCEFASFFKRQGSDVDIVEIAGQLLPGVDSEASKKLLQSLQKMDISVFLNKKVEELDLSSYDKILLAVGRKPFVSDLWDEKLGIKVEKSGVVVDRELRTGVRNIFAAGDCIGGYMLAHVASYEGELAVNNMFLKRAPRDYSSVPASIFTTPEIGVIGLSEDEVKKIGVNYKVGKVHFLSVGMAHILEDTQGFVKVLIQAESGRILGATMIGIEATELVNFFSLAMKNKLSIMDLRKTIFAHPSISEIIAEVARSFDLR